MSEYEKRIIIQLEKDINDMKIQMNEMQVKIEEVMHWKKCVRVVVMVMISVFIGLCIWKYVMVDDIIYLLG